MPCTIVHVPGPELHCYHPQLSWINHQFIMEYSHMFLLIFHALSILFTFNNCNLLMFHINMSAYLPLTTCHEITIFAITLNPQAMARIFVKAIGPPKTGVQIFVCGNFSMRLKGSLGKFRKSHEVTECSSPNKWQLVVCVLWTSFY